MYLVKEIRNINNSIFAISFQQSERNLLGMNEGDYFKIEISPLMKAYKCNNCDGVAYLRVEEQHEQEDTEIKCEKCNNIQKLADSITIADYKKELERKAENSIIKSQEV